MTENHKDIEFIQELAGAMDDVLKEKYQGKIGFTLILFEFTNKGTSNYISNTKREDMIEVLKETVSVLEKKQDDPYLRPFET